jgi:hypothetical protein
VPRGAEGAGGGVPRGVRGGPPYGGHPAPLRRSVSALPYWEGGGGAGRGPRAAGEGQGRGRGARGARGVGGYERCVARELGGGGEVAIMTAHFGRHSAAAAEV